MEGALLFNEVAKTSSTAMGAGDFRHGPVEIVNHDFRGLIFAPDSPTSELNRALARDLRSFGGSVRVIGPACGEAAEFWPTAPVPDCLAPLVEIVPVQFAALRLAQWRGIIPGRFRYVPQVTTSELAFELPAL
jgi:glucosamine--fructose-6-phosphate aminotransferase (isomerizing)